jgi:malonyl-CoA/methylmalonyl-CoA synthetase
VTVSPATLTEALVRRLDQRGEDAALLWHDRALTFSELNAWSAGVAASLHHRGIKSGERVAVGLPNSPDLIATVLGVLRAGAVLVPLNPAYTAAEAAHIVNDAGASLIVTHDVHAAALRSAAVVTPMSTAIERSTAPAPPCGRGPGDPALIVYTSGTTGLPKGAVLSQHALLSNLTTVASAWHWTASDRLLLTLPCFHLHGLALGILGSMLVGSSIVLRPRFVADEVPELLAETGCTMFFGVPTMYNRLVTLPQPSIDTVDLRGMRLWVSGSAPLTTATFTRFRERFDHEILERFGMSEGGFMIATPYEGPRRPGVVGKSLPGIDIRFIDPDAADRGEVADVPAGEPGEIIIQGPNLFSGYWQRPNDTAQAFVGGYFRSGDLAVVEPDGMIRIVGRRSVDIIKSRGFKISAVEIENCLQAHPAVAEVAVVGIPDPDQGEVVTAVITTMPGAALSTDEVRSHARAALAPHKVPRRVVFIDEIPRTGPGKFKKRELIERLR